MFAALDTNNPRYELYLNAICTVHGEEIDSLH